MTNQMSYPTDDDKEELLLSCRFGDLPDVQQFLASFDPAPSVLDAIQDDNANTVLHMAAANGHAGESCQSKFFQGLPDQTYSHSSSRASPRILSHTVTTPDRPFSTGRPSTATSTSQSCSSSSLPDQGSISLTSKIMQDDRQLQKPRSRGGMKARSGLYRSCL